jgi:hypothetical protein
MHVPSHIIMSMYSDMVMIVGEEKKRIPGHRVVLAAGSPLLEATILKVVTLCCLFTINPTETMNELFGMIAEWC